MGIQGYSKIIALGKRATKNIFDGEVEVQEKVDGSQISFSIDEDGVVNVRSKGAKQNAEVPEANKMFEAGILAILAVKDKLTPGYTYRGEYLSKPKHNVLAYSRVPKNHIVIFDIDMGDQDYMNHVAMSEEADRLGFEAIPLLFRGKVESAEQLKSLLETESFLGGTKIEGFVVKRYDILINHLGETDPTGKVLMGKFVSDSFKEVHRKEWKVTSRVDIIKSVGEGLRTEARWQKAVQHLRDDGRLTDSLKDIGPLMKEVNRDILDEEKASIMEALWKAFRKDIMRVPTQGLPDWYKNKLMESVFDVPELDEFVTSGPCADSGDNYETPEEDTDNDD